MHSNEITLIWQRLQLTPDQADLWFELAQAYATKGMHWQAGIATRHGELLEPVSGRPHAILKIGSASARGHVDETVDRAERSLLREKTSHSLASALPALRLFEADLQGQMGDAAGQFETLQQSMKAHRKLTPAMRPGAGPSLAEVQAQRLVSILGSSVALSSLYAGELDAADLASLHRSLCAALQAAVPQKIEFGNDRRMVRQLRVGLVAAHNPVVEPFLLPWLARLNHSAMQVMVYESGSAHSEALKACADRWLDTTDLDDAQLHQVVVADGVDILVDLAGHQPGNRLGLFARRVAPVQVSFLGYPHSTGMASMDWWVGDEVVSPLEHAPLFSETIAHLPRCMFAWLPERDDPLPPPRHVKAAVVFGSLNQAIHLTPRCIALWAKVLNAVPGSQLLLSASSFGEAAVQSVFKTQFAAHGVVSERIYFSGHSEPAEMAQAHGQMDIALDPTPFNGCATTLQALWMGVPVVTLKGGHAASRLGASLLHALGQAGWVTENESDYVTAAVNLARDVAALRLGRAFLRKQLAASSICDLDGYAIHFQTLLQQMWADHCAE
ncbi:hypothetical protein [Limnohabitans sp. Rim8]|uniref:O-linked N-acetylglucosamine transferase, SPINDLY family protein n=1 Tax=Limnohabitans sp. Rim8 TaxID=1100718 RepID=UPI003305B2D6